MTSPYLTTAEAAAYVRKTTKAFEEWTRRAGVRPDGRAGRINLYTAASLDRVVKAMALRPVRRSA